uniref:Sorting nexin 4 n=1 Tax=Nothobranchius rachovii TaxID=451742 RepID=A0A1A8QE48_9TELE
MAEDGQEDSGSPHSEPDRIAPDESLNSAVLGEGSRLLRRMEICVSEAEKRSCRNAVSMLETFTVYLIETRPLEPTADGRNSSPDSVWRRYSEFELLRNYLIISYPYIVMPPLPEKRAEFVWHKLSADNMDPDFVERRRVGLENFLLRVASHSVLSNDKILHHFLTKEQGWKDLEHVSMCRKHELTQFELEMASQDLISKKQQREELATGIVRTFSFKGMTNKIFGQEAPEQREARLNLLEELTSEGEEAVKEKTAECDEHAERAVTDILHFKEQKDKDLQEALISYALMQISMCKKGIQVWSNARECFLKM